MLCVACGDGSIIFERKIQAIDKERARLAKQRGELIKKLNGLNAEINGLDTKLGPLACPPTRMLYIMYGDGNIIVKKKLQLVNGERARLEKIRDELLNKLQQVEGKITSLDKMTDDYIELQNKMESTKHELQKKGVMKLYLVRATEEVWVEGNERKADDGNMASKEMAKRTLEAGE
ncbi:hypothetical protein VTJ04DRAFT_10247 [Mycothermus thermophilus]|uniref:uncharacterized protein n=1 Tax=Humicola insolens TaxID=85995 RepID=UPI003742932B